MLSRHSSSYIFGVIFLAKPTQLHKLIYLRQINWSTGRNVRKSSDFGRPNKRAREWEMKRWELQTKSLQRRLQLFLPAATCCLFSSSDQQVPERGEPNCAGSSISHHCVQWTLVVDLWAPLLMVNLFWSSWFTWMVKLYTDKRMCVSLAYWITDKLNGGIRWVWYAAANSTASSSSSFASYIWFCSIEKARKNWLSLFAPTC